MAPRAALEKSTVERALPWALPLQFGFQMKGRVPFELPLMEGPSSETAYRSMCGQ